MLYIVATPIGNLEDITLRALRTMKESDYIFAEDTRQTKKLAVHFEIDTTIHIYNEQNKRIQIKNILNLLKNGKKVSLVTDAGTPCISDPGYELVDEVLKEGLKVVPIPGVSSLTAAASVSGLNMRRIAFEGFLPKKKGRQTLFNSLKTEERAIIIFESPNRLIKTLKEIESYLGNRYVVVCREITKIYEEITRGYVKEVIESYENRIVKGEIVLIIDGIAKGEKYE